MGRVGVTETMGGEGVTEAVDKWESLQLLMEGKSLRPWAEIRISNEYTG